MGKVKTIHVTDEEWKNWKERKNITINKLTRILFPEGLAYSKRLAKFKPAVLPEDEANLE
jgi:hypothetical protein